MVNAPEGLNQVILRKVRRFWSFVCQKKLPRTIVFCKKKLPKTIGCCQKSCQKQSFVKNDRLLPKNAAKMNFGKKQSSVAKKHCQKQSFVAKKWWSFVKNDHFLPKNDRYTKYKSFTTTRDSAARMGQSRMTHFQRMTHFPAFQLANFFIPIGWDSLEKVVLPYNSAIWRKKPCDN